MTNQCKLIDKLLLFLLLYLSIFCPLIVHWLAIVQNKKMHGTGVKIKNTTLLLQNPID